MAAARLDAALWELHRPLQEAPDGAEPAFAVATPAWISSLNFFATSAASNFGMLKIARG